MGFQYPVLTVLIPICPTEVRPYLEKWGAGPKRVFGKADHGVRKGRTHESEEKVLCGRREGSVRGWRGPGGEGTNKNRV